MQSGVVFNPFKSATKALRKDLDDFRASLNSAIVVYTASILFFKDDKNPAIKNLVEGTRLNFEALKKSFDGPYDRMISEVDKIDEYSQIDLSQNNYNFNLTPNRSRELTNVNRILHHTFQTPAKTATDPPTQTATDPPTQTATDPTTPERPNEQSTRRISKTGKKNPL